jgi:hypothetical protein
LQRLFTFIVIVETDRLTVLTKRKLVKTNLEA